MVSYPVRFPPGTELRSALQNFARENGLEAAFIITCCGSVSKVKLRFAQPQFGGSTARYNILQVEILKVELSRYIF